MCAFSCRSHYIDSRNPWCSPSFSNQAWQHLQQQNWLVVWNINFIFPYIGNNHPNWLSYFSEGWPNHQPENMSSDTPKGCRVDGMSYQLLLRKHSRCSWQAKVYSRRESSLLGETHTPNISTSIQSSLVKDRRKGQQMNSLSGDLRSGNWTWLAELPHCFRPRWCLKPSLVGGLVAILYFCIYWELGMSSSQLTFIFFRGVA